MSKPIVYLAGAIANQRYHEAVDWRDEARVFFDAVGVTPLSPMRAKRKLDRPGPISNDFRTYSGSEYGPFYTSRGIMTRDHNDVKRSDVLLVNLEGLAKPSLGTIMELGWAYTYQKPVVCCLEPDNIHLTHPMVAEAIGALRFDDLNEAMTAVLVVLGIE